MAPPEGNAIVSEQKRANAPEGSGRALCGDRKADKGFPVQTDDDLAIRKL
jgi:hypothetical protein